MSARLSLALINFQNNSQVFHVLEAVPQIAQKGMVQMFQHPSFSYYVPYALRANNLIFPNVFERKREAGVFSLHNTDLAKGAFAYYS